MEDPVVPRPKNYLVESILVTILCCPPLEIVGIINAANVNSRYDEGDYNGAEKASEEAKKWALIGLIGGIALVGLWIVIVMFTGLSMLSF